MGDVTIAPLGLQPATDLPPVSGNGFGVAVDKAKTEQQGTGGSPKSAPTTDESAGRTGTAVANDTPATPDQNTTKYDSAGNAAINKLVGADILPTGTAGTTTTSLPPEALKKQVAADQQALAQAQALAQGKAQERSQIATMVADATNAQSIAAKAGNQAGVVFTTAVLGVLNTIAASGGTNAGDSLEKAAIGLGKTTTEFLKLVGEGDVAAFGVVIGDLGGVLNGLQGGQPGKLLSSSMSTVGDTIKAYGISSGDKYQQFVGTVLSGTGSLIDGLNNGKTDGGLPPGLALAGGIATSLANLSGDKGVAALGTALTGASTAADYFNKSQGLLAQGTIAGTVGTVVGGLIGGKDGQKVALGGDLINNAFAFAANGVPGAASGNVLSIGLDVAQLLGAKIDPGVSSIGSLAASVLSGPIGWVSAGIQIIGSLFNMGDHNKDVTLQENINATGRILTSEADKPTDKVSILDHTNIGFLNIGSSHSSTIQYDVSGVNVDQRLLKDVQYSIVPETYSPTMTTDYESTGATLTLRDGTQLTGNYIRGYNEDTGVRTDQFTGIDGAVYKVGYVGDSDSLVRTVQPIPTGNYVLDVTSNYNSINPVAGGASGTTTVVISAADAARYKSVLGADSGSFGANEATKVAVVKPQLDGQSLRFKGPENNPTYVYYADVNADKIPDMISINLNMNGLERKGDGSVTVTLLDKDRKTIGQPVVANGSSDITANLKSVGNKVADMLKTEQLRPLVTLYTAAHPEIWDKGKDYVSATKTLTENGVLPKLIQAQTLNTQLATALVTPGADVGGLVTQLQSVVKDLKLDFNPTSYAAANPDLSKAYGTNQTALAEHYINTGNSEARSVTTDGAKVAQYVPATLRGMTNLGSSITNGDIGVGQGLVSANGGYVAKMQSDGNFVIYNTATGAATWSTQTQKQDHTGWFFGAGSWSDPPGARFAVQSDGNVVIYSAEGKVRWSPNSYNSGANRAFKLTMQDDGNLVLYDSQKGASNWNNPEGGPALWASSGGLQRRAADTSGTVPAFEALVSKSITYGSDSVLPGSANIGTKATLAEATNGATKAMAATPTDSATKAMVATPADSTTRAMVVTPTDSSTMSTVATPADSATKAMAATPTGSDGSPSQAANTVVTFSTVATKSEGNSNFVDSPNFLGAKPSSIETSNVLATKSVGDVITSTNTDTKSSNVSSESVVKSSVESVDKQKLQGLEYIASYKDLILLYGANADAGNKHMETQGKKEERRILLSAEKLMEKVPDLKKFAEGNPIKAVEYYIGSQLRAIEKENALIRSKMAAYK
jgi:hypothetical protein